MRLAIAVLACLAVTPVTTLKILAYNPIFAHSHSNFIGRIADVLAEAGHEVVSFSPIIETNINNVSSRHARTIFVPKPENAKTFEGGIHSAFASNWERPAEPIEMLKPMFQMAEAIAAQCAVTLSRTDLIEELRAEKFDVAYSESFDQCGYYLFHILGIEKFATAISVSAIDGDQEITGAPTMPSFVPTIWSRFTDRMTFMERVENTIAVPINWIVAGSYHKGIDALREQYPELPYSLDVEKNSTYFFFNAEPLIDFPRITSPKLVSIGGITVDKKNAKPLNHHWSTIFDLRPKTVLVSFGTVMRSSLMPAHYKEALKNTFRSLPNVTFIWKYEEMHDNVGDGVENLVLADWVPQTDMLLSGRLSAFISHSGQGSTTEAIHAGVPMISIPVMGDQFHNARVMERAGSGMVMAKEGLADSRKLEAALHTVLFTDKYVKQAALVARMLDEQPQSARDRLVSHFEFMAKFGPLRQMDPYSRQMGWIQYLLIDVFAFLSMIVITVSSIVAYIIYRVVRYAKFIIVKHKKE